MIYDNASTFGSSVWWSLYPHSDLDYYEVWPQQWLLLMDPQLDALLADLLALAEEECNLFAYALAADYIEEKWDRLLSICETAAGVDPEPLLQRLLERLRTEWADCLNGVGK